MSRPTRNAFVSAIIFLIFGISFCLARLDQRAVRNRERIEMLESQVRQLKEQLKNSQNEVDRLRSESPSIKN